MDIYLDFRKGGTFSCPLCGTSGCKVHDSTMKSWRHMNLFQYKAYLHARLPRVDCPSHGIHTAKVPWLGRVAALPCFLRPSPCP
ncbi:transposase [Aminithiophilus ramosus]|uniref:Transposase n=2 Tax=Aminithiophilus ramosus TaxID=3029084 RepID=A0A9Q7F0E2_9BACT|nr:transposase [Aminithiophilus ramosus]